MFAPELRATTNTIRGEENLAVFVPGPGFFRGSGDCLEDVFTFFGFVEQGFQFGAVKPVFFRHLVDKGLSACIVREVPCRRYHGCQAAQQQNHGIQ